MHPNAFTTCAPWPFDQQKQPSKEVSKCTVWGISAFRVEIDNRLVKSVACWYNSLNVDISATPSVAKSSLKKYPQARTCRLHEKYRKINTTTTHNTMLQHTRQGSLQRLNLEMWWSLVKFREAKATETMQSRETSLGNVWNAGNLSTILPGWTRPDWRLKVWSEDCPLNNSTTPYYFSMYITYISSWWFQASWKILVKLSPLKLSGYLGDLCTHGQGASKKSTTPTDLWNHHLDMIYYILLYTSMYFISAKIYRKWGNQRQISYIKLNIHISLPSFP